MQLNRIITLIALMQCCSLTFAQSPSDLPANAGPFNLRANQMAVFNERLAGSISPLLFDSLTKGDITFDKKQRYENVLLNYDAMEDNVVAKMDALGKIVVIRKESVSDFVLFTPNGVQLAFERKSINTFS